MTTTITTCANRKEAGSNESFLSLPTLRHTSQPKLGLGQKCFRLSEYSLTSNVGSITSLGYEFLQQAGNLGSYGKIVRRNYVR